MPDKAYGRITGEEWDRSTRYSYESYSNAEGWAAAWLPHLTAPLSRP
ncbi:hypothetical protein [Streptomyces sp. NPDC101776]